MNIDLTIEDFFQSDNKNFENLIIDVNGAEYILKNIMNYKEIIHLKKIKREILIRLFDNDTLIGFCSYQIKKDEAYTSHVYSISVSLYKLIWLSFFL